MKELSFIEREINLLHMLLKGYSGLAQAKGKGKPGYTTEYLTLACSLWHSPAKPLPFTVMSSFCRVVGQKEDNPLLNTLVISYFTVSSSSGICQQQQTKELVADVFLRDT